MAFNLNDYQTVAERLDEAIKAHGDIRVITSLEHTERIDGRPHQYIMKAEIWLGTTLVSTGWAEEIVGSSPVNKSSALENCETSAIGRALANLGFQGKAPASTRPSRTEMEKAERIRRAEQEQVKQANPLDWGEPELPPPAPNDPFASWEGLEVLEKELGAEVMDVKPTRKYFGSQNAANGSFITQKQENYIRKLFAEKHPDGDLQAYVTEVTGQQISHLSELPKLAGSALIEKLKG